MVIANFVLVKKGFQAGPGFRTHVFTNGRHQRFRQNQFQQQQRQQGDFSILANIIQLLPLLLFLVLSLVSLFASEDDPFAFQRSRHFNDMRTTKQHGVSYYVNPSDIAKRFPTTTKQQHLESQVELQYLRVLQSNCAREREVKQLRVQQAYGLFGVNKKQLDQANAMRMPNCDALNQW